MICDSGHWTLGNQAALRSVQHDMRRTALIAVIALLLAACGAGPAGDGGISYDGAWQLESATIADETLQLIDTHPITLAIDSTRINGTAACNGYGGNVSFEDGFRTDDISVTEMACHPPETLDLESSYLEALGLVEDGTITADHLTLSGPRVDLEFFMLEPVPTAGLLGTVWVLTGLVDGDAVTSVSGERATLEFFSDGSFIGSTGCRDINGSYEASGDRVVFTRWGANGTCPEELSDQDSRVVSGLEGGFRVQINDRVMATWVAGDEGLTYKADS